MGESTQTTLKERIVLFFEFPCVFALPQPGCIIGAFLCILQFNVIPHIDGNLSDTIDEQNQLFLSLKQERYSRLQFWCGITYIEISGLTECQVSVGLGFGSVFLLQCIFVSQNHGLNLALTYHRHYCTNTKIGLLQLIPQIQILIGLQKSVQSGRKTCSRQRLKMQFLRVAGCHRHREKTQAPVPISTVPLWMAGWLQLPPEKQQPNL